MFQSSETVSSLTDHFCNHSQKRRETADAFAEKLPIVMHKSLAFKTKPMWEANQVLKYQHTHNLHDPFHGVIAWGQYLSFPNFQNFTQFRGQLMLMFGSWGKNTKPSNVTTSAVTAGTGEDDAPQEPLLHNSYGDRMTSPWAGKWPKNSSSVPGPAHRKQWPWSRPDLQERKNPWVVVHYLANCSFTGQIW